MLGGAALGFSPTTLFTSDAAAQRSLFSQFKTAFNKTYAAAEEPARLAAFVDNLKRIDERNAEDTAVHGITKFCDLTADEFKASFLNYQEREPSEEADVPPLEGTASDVDWRGSKYVTAVKDQGQCGSCWAFSATEQIETDVAFATGSLLQLSPQQITSCDHLALGCNGGNTGTAYRYVKNAGGIEANSDYPYVSGTTKKGGLCTFDKSAAKATIGGFSTISRTKSGESKMLTQIAKSPISVCVDAETWQTYKSGIVGASCGTSVDHCVQAVGYKTGATNYWRPHQSRTPHLPRLRRRDLTLRPLLAGLSATAGAPAGGTTASSTSRRASTRAPSRRTPRSPPAPSSWWPTTSSPSPRRRRATPRATRAIRMLARTRRPARGATSASAARPVWPTPAPAPAPRGSKSARQAGSSRSVTQRDDLATTHDARRAASSVEQQRYG
jgi:cathepsin F